ncbi:MAG TPA: DNA-binding domain-containing protein [Gemmataceae bacterium]|nr:DNA-binding domain-containing protein [Gemmataceae bacterium]
MNPTYTPRQAFPTLQRWMQATIMHPDGVVRGMNSLAAREEIDDAADEAEKVVTRSKALTAVERLSIYSHAYHARLVECMREEFPSVAHALGDETFDAFAAAYLQTYPSCSYTLTRLGMQFPNFLAETRPQREEGEPEVSWPEFLADLARFEWTFSEVFDGPGVEGKELLDAAAIQAVPADGWLEARLGCVKCLRLLALRYPVHRYFAAVRRHEEAVMPEPADTYLAVTRRNFVVHHYELSRPAYALLSALVAGRPVGEAVGAAAEAAGPEKDQLGVNLRAWFHNWAAEGFFQNIAYPG